MWRENMPVRLIVDISHLLPVYIIHTCGRHYLELSEDFYHLADMISHSLALQYVVLHYVGRQTDLIRVLGNHVSVLPAWGRYI